MDSKNVSRKNRKFQNQDFEKVPFVFGQIYDHFTKFQDQNGPYRPYLAFKPLSDTIFSYKNVFLREF